MQDCETADGTPFKLAAAPVPTTARPPKPRRAPEFNEHGDEILTDLGLDWDTVVDLKVRGVRSRDAVRLAGRRRGQRGR